MSLRKSPTIPFEQRAEHLTSLRNLKMARSAHSYVRGNTKRFYEWLDARQKDDLPEGPAVWICGDCHIGNLGPVADLSAQIQVQIRDIDQTVIGNPAHDLIRLGLSLAMAARGSDLPGFTTAVMIENLVDGYTSAIESEVIREDKADEADSAQPQHIKVAMQAAAGRSWKELAEERLKDHARLPIGKRFWKLTKEEDKAIAQLFEKGAVSRLATMLSSRADDVPVEVVDAAYWVKGCSSLGNLRYAVLLGIGRPQARDYELCLVDIKEAVIASAPSLSKNMPVDHARRVVEGARHLSPHLGERMMATELLGKSVFLRELMPQDLKLEIARLSPMEATEVSRYLAGVVGKAHARQMDVQTSKSWIADLRKSGSKTLDAPSWLWNSIVDLVANHEAGYLEHCRRYCLGQAAA